MLIVFVSVLGPFLFGFYSSLLLIYLVVRDIELRRRGYWRMLVAWLLNLVLAVATPGLVFGLLMLNPVPQNNPNLADLKLFIFSHLAGAGAGGLWVSARFFYSLARGWGFYTFFADLYPKLGERTVEILVTRAQLSSGPALVERCLAAFRRWVLRRPLPSAAQEAAIRQQRMARRVARAARSLGITPEAFNEELRQALQIFALYLGEGLGLSPAVPRPTDTPRAKDYPLPGTPEWVRMNQERAALIRKKVRGELTPEERERYEFLQAQSLAALEASFPRGGDAP